MVSKRTKNDTADDSREAARQRLERRRARSGASSGDGDDARKARSSRSSARNARPGAASSDVRVIHIPRPVVIAAGVLFLVALFAGVNAIEHSCARESAVDFVEADTEQPAQNEEPAPEPEQADLSLLPADLPQEDVDSLTAQASDSRIVFIVNNRQQYVDAFGEERATKLLQLAAREPDAVDFVASLPDSYPASSGKPYEEQVSKAAFRCFFSGTNAGAMSNTAQGRSGARDVAPRLFPWCTWG